MRSLFLLQHDAPSQPIRPQVSHSVRTALAADALAPLLGLPNYCARMKLAYPTSNNGRSMTRQIINRTNSIVTSLCAGACALRFRADTASKSVGMITQSL